MRMQLRWCAHAGGSCRSLRQQTARWPRWRRPKRRPGRQLAELSEVLRAQLDIAALNTPKQTVISGGAEAVAALVGHFKSQGRRVTRLTVSHAFHSAHMNGMLEAFGKVAEGITYHAPTLTVISNVTGKQADVARGELVSADYWVRPVRRAGTIC